MWDDKRSACKRGYDRQWRKLAQLVMQRDTGLCQPCYKSGRITAAKQVDHVKNKAKGGTDDMGNLQAICLECHKIKTYGESGHRTSMGCDSKGMPRDPKHHWSARH